MLALAAPTTGCGPAGPMAPGSARAPHAGTALDEFEATLAGHASATAALEQWCAGRGIAPQAQVRATLIDDGVDPGEAAMLAQTARRALGLGPAEPLGFRHVRLDCGGTVLSEAFNWYAPALLTDDMNRLLATTRTPFGKATAPLGYRRELIDSRRDGSAGCPAGVILSHRAMLRLPDGHPLAVLVECYTQANLRP
jgi:hypothetical protein